MKDRTLILILACAGLLVSGCAAGNRPRHADLRIDDGESTAMRRVKKLSPEIKTRILSLNPERVTEEEVRDLLSPTAAPQVISIHGGIFPIKTGMNSFAQFLVGMGYPDSSIRHPRDGSYTYGYYDRSDEIAGAVAWYYERDGLRPMLVGHSQGGIQTVRVLHKLAGGSGARLAVWNPLNWADEHRYEIRDPLTGTNRPAAGMLVSYAVVAVAGGLARALPNQWDMNSRLRKIPDSVEEFTGFQKGMDILGGDYLGYGAVNEYHATGIARVRNVRLPAGSPHSTIPYVGKLLNNPAAKAWIASYDPKSRGENGFSADPDVKQKSAQILWAAEVWHGIKKHWVLELQQLIRAQNANEHDV